MDYWAAGFTPQTWGIVVSGLAAVFFSVWSSAESEQKRIAEAAQAETRRVEAKVEADARHATVVQLLSIANAAVAEQVELRRQEASARTEAEAAALRAQALQGEVNRREAVLSQLRNLYILSHDGISSELIAGTAWPPDAWTNSELRKLGEGWTVRTVGATVHWSPPPA